MNRRTFPQVLAFEEKATTITIIFITIQAVFAATIYTAVSHCEGCFILIFNIYIYLLQSINYFKTFENHW